MGWEIRPAAVEDIPDLVRVDWAAFGDQPTDEDIDDARTFLEIDRALVAVDGTRLAGTTAAISLELTVPGPALVPTAGVTYTGVLPTHRRQGILTALLGRLHDDARRRGEPASALLASESSIYRRFGYGVAVRHMSVEIERSHARLRRPVDVGGRVRMVAPGDMADVLPPIHDAYRRRQPGETGRRPEQWTVRLRDRRSQRNGASARFAVVWEDDGRPTGYVTYRVRENWDDGLPGHTLSIEDLVANTPGGRAGLWQYCFDVDLVRRIEAWNVPVDDPLWWMLVDPRRLRITGVKDFLWLRILDVEAALAARTYAADDHLVIEVLDDRRQEVAGRYAVDGASEGGPAGCHRTRELPDLALDVADLASAYLGGVRLATLERAGLVSELVPGAVARADAMFAASPGPASSTSF